MMFLESIVRFHSLANVATYPPGAVFGPRKTTSFEFVWLTQGTATWQLLDPHGVVTEERLLTPGTIALSAPGATERYIWDASHGGSHAYVHFHLPPCDTHGWPRLRLATEHPPICGIVSSLFDVAIAGSSAIERTEQIVGLVLESFLGDPVPSEIASAASLLVDRAIHYMRRVWSSPESMRIVAITEIAGAIGVSTAHLSRTFSNHVGVTPARAFELIRLARAAVRLQRTERTLAQIAAECGFADEFHLSRRFALGYGMRPGKYRKQRLDADPLSPIIDANLMSLWNVFVRDDVGAANS